MQAVAKNLKIDGMSFPCKLVQATKGAITAMSIRVFASFMIKTEIG
ncbi:acetolactate synthase II large subunit [Rhodobacterales bacterium HTCC2150]|nr:acetolactate synthase II large subunit [Rhodobacterales bacterium HTCC2150] [Rhodobacteraceae bacterium HTCC2150]